jgi:hypothetical protein
MFVVVSLCMKQMSKPLSSSGDFSVLVDQFLLRQLYFFWNDNNIVHLICYHTKQMKNDKHVRRHKQNKKLIENNETHFVLNPLLLW